MRMPSARWYAGRVAPPSPPPAPTPTRAQGLCLAGSENPTMRASLRDALERLGWGGAAIRIDNDSVGAALTDFPRGAPRPAQRTAVSCASGPLSPFPAPPGSLVVISGTGSIAQLVSRDGDATRLVRAGGWGHMVGDGGWARRDRAAANLTCPPLSAEGSGYDLSRRAIQAVFRLRDGLPVMGEALVAGSGAPAPFAAAHARDALPGAGADAAAAPLSPHRLWERLCEHFGVREEQDMLPLLHTDFEKARIASFGAVVAEGAPHVRKGGREPAEGVALTALRFRPTLQKPARAIPYPRRWLRTWARCSGPWCRQSCAARQRAR